MTYLASCVTTSMKISDRKMATKTVKGVDVMDAGSEANAITASLSIENDTDRTDTSLPDLRVMPGQAGSCELSTCQVVG